MQGASVGLGEVRSWATEGRAPGTQHPVPRVSGGQASALRPAPSTPRPLGTVTMQVVVGVSRRDRHVRFLLPEFGEADGNS